MESELSEEFLSQLTDLERKFIVSWEKLQKSEEFQQKIIELKNKKLYKCYNKVIGLYFVDENMDILVKPMEYWLSMYGFNDIDYKLEEVNEV